MSLSSTGGNTDGMPALFCGGWSPPVSDDSGFNGAPRRASPPASSRLETLPDSLALLDILESLDLASMISDLLRVFLPISLLEVSMHAKRICGCPPCNALR